jgi:hypothetical protein
VGVLERIVHGQREAPKVTDVSRRDAERSRPGGGQDEEVAGLDGPAPVPRFGFERGAGQRGIAIERDDVTPGAELPPDTAASSTE